MWLALLAIPAGILLGVGVCAHLAHGDTKQGVHPNTMGGPKQRAALLRQYRWLAIGAGLIGWVAVTNFTTSWLAFALGLLGGIVGRAMFNRMDRRMTRYIG